MQVVVDVLLLISLVGGRVPRNHECRRPLCGLDTHVHSPQSPNILILCASCRSLALLAFSAASAALAATTFAARYTFRLCASSLCSRFLACSSALIAAFNSLWHAASSLATTLLLWLPPFRPLFVFLFPPSQLLSSPSLSQHFLWIFSNVVSRS